MFRMTTASFGTRSPHSPSFLFHNTRLQQVTKTTTQCYFGSTFVTTWTALQKRQREVSIRYMPDKEPSIRAIVHQDCILASAGTRRWVLVWSVRRSTATLSHHLVMRDHYHTRRAATASSRCGRRWVGSCERSSCVCITPFYYLYSVYFFITNH